MALSSAVYTIELSFPDKNPMKKTISIPFLRRMTHREFISENEGRIATVLKPLERRGTTTLVKELRDDSTKFDIGFDCRENPVKEGGIYYLSLELVQSLDINYDYYCHVWGEKERAETRASSSGGSNVTITKGSNTASGNSTVTDKSKISIVTTTSQHNGRSLSSGPSTASGSGAVGHIQAHNVTINVREKEASSPPKRAETLPEKEGQKRPLKDLTYKEALSQLVNDGDEIIEIVADLGQDKWRPLGYALKIPHPRLNALNPILSGRDLAIEVIHMWMNDTKYPYATWRALFEATDSAKFGGVTEKELRKICRKD